MQIRGLGDIREGNMNHRIYDTPAPDFVLSLMSIFFAIVCELRGKQKHLLIKRDVRAP